MPVCDAPCLLIRRLATTITSHMSPVKVCLGMPLSHSTDSLQKVQAHCHFVERQYYYLARRTAFGHAAKMLATMLAIGTTSVRTFHLSAPTNIRTSGWRHRCILTVRPLHLRETMFSDSSPHCQSLSDLRPTSSEVIRPRRSGREFKERSMPSV